MVPDVPFEYYFLDDDINLQYETEQRWAAIIQYTAIFALFIACLGFFALAALSMVHRTKEVGIRKVLGASMSSIFVLLSKEFIKWVLIANLIAWPIAYYAMNKWLHNFAYRVNISWWIFVSAGTLALVIALLTVSFQAIRAATANPVNALRYE